MTHRELCDQWQARRDEYKRLGVYVEGAKVIDDFLADVEAMVQGQADELLTIAHAAKLSGYSTEHLARLIREGTIPNAGRKNRPRIRRADLPLKRAKPLASSTSEAYSVTADARALRSRLGDR